MRVIGGSVKGRKLKAPIGGSILRPTSDRVREAVFDIIGPDIKDARFLDLFSGTGAVGIEALSRGARSVVFVDSKSLSIELIRINLERCIFQNGFEIVQCDVLQAILTLANRQRKFEYIFLDPPYNSTLGIEVLEELSHGELFTSSTLILFEHLVKKTVPERIGGLIHHKEHKFGDSIIEVFHPIEV